MTSTITPGQAGCYREATPVGPAGLVWWRVGLTFRLLQSTQAERPQLSAILALPADNRVVTPRPQPACLIGGRSVAARRGGGILDDVVAASFFPVENHGGWQRAFDLW